MESISLTLKIDGKDKKFVSPKFINGKLFRQASELADMYENKGIDFNWDEIFQFICDAFGNKFDVDQFEEGTDARRMIKTSYGVIQHVVGNVEQASRLLATGEVKDSGGKN